MVIVKRLAKAVVRDRTPLARGLTPLERQGLMRSAPGEDRRERRVTVPTRGQQAWAEGFPLWEQAQAHVVRDSGRERLQRVLSDLATRGTLIRQR
jgi:DNA-binding MarR family transcriptional regulator